MPKPKKSVEEYKADAAQAQADAGSKPFMIAVTRLLSQLNGLQSEDSKHNIGRALSEAFKWDAAAKLCEGRSDAAWKTLASEGIINKEGLSPGDHTLADSPHFVCLASVTQPVRRFNADALAEEMVKRFKCSRADALMMIEDAKKPASSTVRMKIVEK